MIKFVPEYDKDFSPIIVGYKEFIEQVEKVEHNTVYICVERNGGYNYNFSMPVYPDGVNDEMNFKIVERMVKAVLWVVGGYKIYVKGSEKLFKMLKSAYDINGERKFDNDFMHTCYLKPFEVVAVNELPLPKDSAMKVGGHTEGARIGFDAGGSDFKVCAVENGKVLYSEEIIWNPKTQVDPDYHYKMIEMGLKKASSHLPKVDAIGVSSAGVIIDNKPMVSSLFVSWQATHTLVLRTF